MSQRLAKIELLRHRFWGSGTFAFNMALYSVVALDVVQFSLSLLRFNNKLLEVTNSKFTLGKNSEGGVTLGTELELKETDPSVYEWSSSEELTPQGFQQSYVNTPGSVAGIAGGLTVNGTGVV